MDRQRIVDEVLSPDSKFEVPPPIFCRVSDEELSAAGDTPPPIYCHFVDEELSAAAPMPCTFSRL